MVTEATQRITKVEDANADVQTAKLLLEVRDLLEKILTELQKNNGR